MPQGVINIKIYFVVYKPLQHIAMTNKHENTLLGKINTQIYCNGHYERKHNAKITKTKTYCKEQETLKHNAKYKNHEHTLH